MKSFDQYLNFKWINSGRYTVEMLLTRGWCTPNDLSEGCLHVYPLEMAIITKQDCFKPFYLFNLPIKVIDDWLHNHSGCELKNQPPDQSVDVDEGDEQLERY